MVSCLAADVHAGWMRDSGLGLLLTAQGIDMIVSNMMKDISSLMSMFVVLTTSGMLTQLDMCVLMCRHVLNLAIYGQIMGGSNTVMSDVKMLVHSCATGSAYEVLHPRQLAVRRNMRTSAAITHNSVVNVYFAAAKGPLEH